MNCSLKADTILGMKELKLRSEIIDGVLWIHCSVSFSDKDLTKPKKAVDIRVPFHFLWDNILRCVLIEEENVDKNPNNDRRIVEAKGALEAQTRWLDKEGES